MSAQFSGMPAVSIATPHGSPQRKRGEQLSLGDWPHFGSRAESENSDSLLKIEETPSG